MSTTKEEISLNMKSYSQGDSMSVNFDRKSLKHENPESIITSGSTISVPEAEIPLEVKIDPQWDVCMFYAKNNKEVATEVLKKILSDINHLSEKENNTCRFNGVLFDDDTELPGNPSPDEAKEEIAERSTLSLFYLTPDFKKDTWAEFNKLQHIELTLNNKDKRWTMIPVFEKTADELGFKNIPYGLRGLANGECKYFDRMVKRLYKALTKEENKTKKTDRRNERQRKYNEWINDQIPKEKLKQQLTGQKDAHKKQVDIETQCKARQMLKEKLDTEYNSEEQARAVVNEVIGNSAKGSKHVKEVTGHGVNTEGTVNKYYINSVNTLQVGNYNTSNQNKEPETHNEPGTQYSVVEEMPTSNSESSETSCTSGLTASSNDLPSPAPSSAIQDQLRVAPTGKLMRNVSADRRALSTETASNMPQSSDVPSPQGKVFEKTIQNESSTEPGRYVPQSRGTQAYRSYSTNIAGPVPEEGSMNNGTIHINSDSENLAQIERRLQALNMDNNVSNEALNLHGNHGNVNPTPQETEENMGNENEPCPSTTYSTVDLNLVHHQVGNTGNSTCEQHKSKTKATDVYQVKENMTTEDTSCEGKLTMPCATSSQSFLGAGAMMPPGAYGCSSVHGMASDYDTGHLTLSGQLPNKQPVSQSSASSTDPGVVPLVVEELEETDPDGSLCLPLDVDKQSIAKN